jgi:PRA1 family protein
MDTVRPLPMFLGITGPSFCFSPEAFNPPVKKLDKSTPEKFKSRLKLNFAFFLSNYALVAAGTALIIFLMHPGMLVAMAAVWGLWVLHHYLMSNEVIVFGRNVGTLVSIPHRSNALVVLTTIVIAWKCLIPALTVVTISGLIILTHALLRDPKHIDTTNASASGSSSDYRSHSSDDDDSGGEISHDSSEVLVEKPGQV